MVAVERANSEAVLKLIKTPRRSTVGESRLNALVLLFALKSIPLDLNAVVPRNRSFVCRCPSKTDACGLVDPTHCLKMSSGSVPSSVTAAVNHCHDF